MVAPEDDFPVRPKRRSGLALSIFSEPAQPATDLLDDRRRSLALRTATAFLFGVAFFWPEINDAAVIRLFAAYAFLDGILALAPGGWALPYRLGWPLLIGGSIDVIASATVYAWPGLTLPGLADVAAVWAIASAFAFVTAYVALHRADNDQFFLLGGIVSLILGRALLSQVPIDAIVLSAWMGLYAMTMSVLFLKLTLKHYRLILPL